MSKKELDNKQYRIEVIETGDGWLTKREAFFRSFHEIVETEKVEETRLVINGETAVIARELLMKFAEQESEINRLRAMVQDYRVASNKIMKEGKVKNDK